MNDLICLDDSSQEIALRRPPGGPLAVRAAINDLVAGLRALPEEELVDPMVEHIFAEGMYLRKMFLKKGTLLVGQVHRVECINIVSKGDISVLTETGEARVTAGFTIVTPAGVQKVGYAHEDTEFINVFRTDETDIKKLEEMLGYDTQEEFEQRQQETLAEEVACPLR